MARGMSHGYVVSMACVLALPTQTLPADSLRLSRGEKRALVAFLQSLTDTAGVPQ